MLKHSFSAINETCFICKDNNFKVKKTIKERFLLECQRCGLQFIRPLPDAESLSKIYSDYYKAWAIEKYGQEISKMKTKTFKNYISKINQYISAGKLLDIGCATGELMSVAQENGFDAYGVEISPQGINKCKELFGENKIVAGNLKTTDFPPDFFDIVTLCDVIEHVSDPVTFLDIIYRILKPKGLLMIATPDTLSWVKKLMDSHWLQYKEEHIYYYNRYNISRYLSSRFSKLILSPVYKNLTLEYCSNILKTQCRNKIIYNIVKALEYLPDAIKLYIFRVNIGEMFILFQKI